MKILITGASGMLGADLVKVLSASAQVKGLSKSELDVTDASAVKAALGGYDLVVHAAAYTDVDGCESNEERAFLVNGEGTKNVAIACKERGVPMVYISTDYVFDGKKEAPYIETDACNPINVYGRSKLAGEDHVTRLLDKHYIVRTSWLFGLRGKNFAQTILSLASSSVELKVVDDQTGSPTFTLGLAEAIAILVKKPLYGTYHVAGSGITSWNGFAKEILKMAGLSGIRVIPISSGQLGRPATRPSNSSLSCNKFETAYGHRLKDWRSGLEDYFVERISSLGS
ncbi:MAG: dTDP-4-dehydrorhamnose reductase [Actinomycetota bacterium]|nr:dTDP-4-dehydrorhamnose reductase [Actinomycetota bacterium]